MKKYYPVIFTKEDVGFSAIVPDLDGCFSEGDTFEETYQNVQDAIGLYVEGADAFPLASDPEVVSRQAAEDQFVCIVEFDDLEYRKKHSAKSVKKTLTLPEWLNIAAKEQHVNFSKVLQDALKAQLNL